MIMIVCNHTIVIIDAISVLSQNKVNMIIAKVTVKVQ